MHLSITAAALATLTFHNVARADDALSYLYYDNTEFLANVSNVVGTTWAAVQTAFETPNRTDTASYSGFDWTKPFPGTALDGFGVHLRIADDVPFPESVVHNQSTEITALTYSIPDSLMGSNRLPKAMDPSWYICQHYFVSALPDPTTPIDHSCGFLPAQCRADLQSNLTLGWALEDPDIPCSAFALDVVPRSCQGALGIIRADVLSFDSSYLQDAATAKVLTVDEVAQSSWMIGTGFVKPGNITAYYEASNRTYIIVTVFGYSASSAKIQTPKAEMACLRPEWVPPPPPPTSTTSSTTAIRTSTIGGSTISSQPPSSVTAPTTTTVPPTTTSAASQPCVSGTINEGISGNLLGLCDYSCFFNFCPSDVCKCVTFADAPNPPPETNGLHGCPLPGEDNTYTELCEYTCSHGYCPEGACQFC